MYVDKFPFYNSNSYEYYANSNKKAYGHDYYCYAMHQRTYSHLVFSVSSPRYPHFPICTFSPWTLDFTVGLRAYVQ